MRRVPTASSAAAESVCRPCSCREQDGNLSLPDSGWVHARREPPCLAASAVIPFRRQPKPGEGAGLRCGGFSRGEKRAILTGLRTGKGASVPASRQGSRRVWDRRSQQRPASLPAAVDRQTPGLWEANVVSSAAPKTRSARRCTAAESLQAAPVQRFPARGSCSWRDQ